VIIIAAYTSSQITVSALPYILIIELLTDCLVYFQVLNYPTGLAKRMIIRIITSTR
jgi:hypothetical protein